MARINLTLNDDAYLSLVKHAADEGLPQASMARRLIIEALDRRITMKKLRKLAADYAAEHEDSAQLLADLESGQLQIVDEEDLDA